MNFKKLYNFVLVYKRSFTILKLTNILDTKLRAQCLLLDENKKLCLIDSFILKYVKNTSNLWDTKLNVQNQLDTF